MKIAYFSYAPTCPARNVGTGILGSSPLLLCTLSDLTEERMREQWKLKERRNKSSINWFEKQNISLLSNCLIWCCTSIELWIKDDPDGTSLFVGGPWKINQWGNFHWNSNLWLPSLQSQKFWQDTLAGQAKNPLAREQFTDGCGSSETWIVIISTTTAQIIKLCWICGTESLGWSWSGDGGLVSTHEVKVCRCSWLWQDNHISPGWCQTRSRQDRGAASTRPWYYTRDIWNGHFMMFFTQSIPPPTCHTAPRQEGSNWHHLEADTHTLAQAQMACCFFSPRI